MLIFSMSASADGYIADDDGSIDWGAPSEELFDVHLDRVRSLGATILGRRLYETMLVWETDPDFPSTPAEREFAAAWTDLPKVVFSRTLSSVPGNARLATGTLAEEVAAVLAATDRDVEIGGAHLGAQAVGLGLVDEFNLFRHPVVLGGGTPYFPAVGSRLPLRLVEARTFEPGVVLERYRLAG